MVFEDELRNVQLPGVVAGGRVGERDRIGGIGFPLVVDGVYAVFYAEGRYEAQFVDGVWVLEGVLERDVPTKGMAHHVDLAQIIVLPPLLYPVDEVALILLQVRLDLLCGGAFIQHGGDHVVLYMLEPKRLDLLHTLHLEGRCLRGTVSGQVDSIQVLDVVGEILERPVERHRRGGVPMNKHRGRGHLTGTTVVEVPLVDPAGGHRVVDRPAHAGTVHDLLLQRLQAMHLGTDLGICSGGFFISLAAPFESVCPHSTKKSYVYTCV